MEIIEKSSGQLNSINRDLLVILAIGFIAAITIVTIGIVVVSQI